MSDQNETPRVAVVGCGIWGRNHVRNYAELGALAAVVDHKPEAAEALATSHGVRALGFPQVLADPAIAGVVLALPPSQNRALGTAVLRAGKHLFVEKPMALTTAEAAELCGVAAEAGRQVMVGHIPQYHPAFLALRDLVEAGELGPLLSVVSSRLNLGRIRREEDALWALAPHDVSMVLALAGGAPAFVSASAGYHTHATIADAAHVELRWPGGLRAEIRSSWLHPFKEQRLVVVGRDGMAVFDDAEPWPRKLVRYRHLVTEGGGVVETTRAEPELVALSPAEPLRAECTHFLDCIRTGRTPRTDGREGLRVLAVLEKASAAMAAGRDGAIGA